MFIQAISDRRLHGELLIAPLRACIRHLYNSELFQSQKTPCN